MKIEIGESLLLSWLRHVKECKLVQLNWKASSQWELKEKEVLNELMKATSDWFSSNYGYNIYKQNVGLEQLIAQGEIDVIGINFDDERQHIYGIDVAFHGAGLNYGLRATTVATVIKKIIRTAMCIKGYFGIDTATIIFASPKINPAEEADLRKCLIDLPRIFEEFGLDYQVRIICNDEFNDKVLQPTLNVLDEVADTSELFMRSLKMYNMFASKKSVSSNKRKYSSTVNSNKPTMERIEAEGIEGLEEMKIGVIARKVLRKMLEEGKASKEEVEKMQTSEYSKETFDIQYPLLKKASNESEIKPHRYYANPVKIYGEYYFLCSEWYEVPGNNDRPYLLKWIALRM